MLQTTTKSRRKRTNNSSASSSNAQRVYNGKNMLMYREPAYLPKSNVDAKWDKFIQQQKLN